MHDAGQLGLLCGGCGTLLMMGIGLWGLITALEARKEARALRERLLLLERAVREVHVRLEPLTAPQEPAPSRSPEPEPSEVATPAAAAPDPTPAPPPQIAPPRPPTVEIEWEKWLGVRGAAALGGTALALAGVYFFKYSIEHALIPPSVRVALGTLVGLGCVLGGASLQSRSPSASHGLMGGGVVVLYSAFWAARVLYSLIPMQVAFGLMALTTVTACLLAVRFSSTLVAVLGLLGGFLTPLLLSSGENRPLGLFGYTLLLDIGVLVVALRLKKPALALLALIGTAVLQVGWMASRMEPHQLPVALGVLGVFAIVFAVWATRLQAAQKASTLSLITQSAAVLAPVPFTLYFVTSSAYGQHLWPVALLFALLAFAAGWVGKQSQALGRWLPLSMSTAQLIVVGTWSMGHHRLPPDSWELPGSALGLAAVFALWAEPWLLGENRTSSHRRAALAMTVGAFALVTLNATSAEALRLGLLPLWGTWLVLGSLALRVAHHTHRRWLSPVLAGLGAFGIGLVITSMSNAFGLKLGLSRPELAYGVEFSFALLLYASASFGSDAIARRSRSLAAVSYSTVAIVLWAIPAAMGKCGAHEVVLGTSLLAAIGVFCATRLLSGQAMLSIGASVVLVHSAAAWALGASRAEQAMPALAITLLFGLAWANWPLWVGRNALHDRLSTWAAALFFPFALYALQRFFRLTWGDGFIGLLPLSLAAVSLGQLALVRRARLSAPAHRRHTVFWAAAAVVLVGVAIPLQLERQWMTLGFAVMATGLVLLWRALDHEGLKWTALFLFSVVGARLLLNPSVLEYSQRGAMPIFNWLMYTYLVPILCLALAVWVLQPLERARLRPWEAQLTPQTATWGVVITGTLLLLVIFAYLNLAVFDFFSPGERVVVSFERQPARDLTLSLVWALYAVGVLAMGMWKRSKALRWFSLVFLLGTIAKVFLSDLGNLKDLYRVMSLLGLAASLILVSLGYQRFVFRRESAHKEPSP